MLELWGMRSTSSLPSLSDSLWLKVVATGRVVSMGQIELFDTETECKHITWVKYNYLK